MTAAKTPRQLALAPWGALLSLAACVQPPRPAFPSAPAPSTVDRPEPTAPAERVTSPTTVPGSAVQAAPAAESAQEAPITPPPTTAEERQTVRLDPARTSRVRPFLSETAELHGVSLLATTETASGPVDALLVQVVGARGVESETLVLDHRDQLLARLPRASVDGPDSLRVGALSIPLDERLVLERLGRGEIDLEVASSVLRLAGQVALDRLLQAAAEGWDGFADQSDPDVLALGVQPEPLVLAGQVPQGGPIGVPERFQVDRLLPGSLAGWSTSADSWQGRVRIRIQDEVGAPLVLVVGVQGRLPR